ncbi:5-oxoprolinase subunit PxpB [Christiangramia echinicola]|uniref:Sensor histidine kinase inhibitor, KipI family n=1 Tax=Christiangramia echinicola TaxID=279359 RepID=A0A1H1QGI4_9FLAO|nr:5-oxoprolinase subunit PxpB [Christiangramia echinicola]SDS21979.1 sensor histidine kinase inhibitor, KipI family [Christiangramia echinicola]
MSNYPQISPLGDRSILIDFGGEISSGSLEKVLFFKKNIEKSNFKQKVEVINTYNSLLISYLFTIEDVYGEVLRLKGLVRQANIPKKSNYKIFQIPVCYDKDFGLDLEYISNANNLTIEDIIELHTAPTYQIYFIGFLPGFLYLGGLDKRLHISRKKSPRKSVEKGAVGIGENQTGIYPKSSPGGWQILGKTPIDLFNKNEDPPTNFSAGDKIKFVAVSKNEFIEIEKEIADRNYTLKFENYEG